MQTLPWIAAFVASMLLAVSLGAWAWRVQGHRRPEALPSDWALTARPVFSADERRLYRTLRDALPHHVLLSKLPLLRFCQPTDPGEVRYWHDLLADSHVSFAICSANGRVLAAIDLDGDRNSSRRVARIKQLALSACRVRYLRCAIDQLPTVAELQLLVPGTAAGAHAPQPGPPPRPAPPPLPLPVREVPTATVRRSPRPVLWQDTTVFQDSFFPSDDDLDDAGTETFEPASGRRAAAPQLFTPARFFGAAEIHRRGPPSADFAPTRQGVEDDDEDDDGSRGSRGGRGGRSPRFFPGSRP